jgi:quercetin dioxygenase-like cupin family protein
MKRMTFALVAAFGALAITPGLTLAAPAPSAAASAFNELLPNVPGKSIVASVVSYPPGGKSGPHTHAHSAFIVGYVLSGAVRSQVDDGEVRVFQAGEHFTEKPGAHHTVSENASTTEPARLLAIFVVDTADTMLTTPDVPAR